MTEKRIFYGMVLVCAAIAALVLGANAAALWGYFSFLPYDCDPQNDMLTHMTMGVRFLAEWAGNTYCHNFGHLSVK